MAWGVTGVVGECGWLDIELRGEERMAEGVDAPEDRREETPGVVAVVVWSVTCLRWRDWVRSTGVGGTE